MAVPAMVPFMGKMFVPLPLVPWPKITTDRPRSESSVFGN
jgi:hypothetical protein